jgi:hypothetical protein
VSERLPDGRGRDVHFFTKYGQDKESGLPGQARHDVKSMAGDEQKLSLVADAALLENRYRLDRHASESWGLRRWRDKAGKGQTLRLCAFA